MARHRRASVAQAVAHCCPPASLISGRPSGTRDVYLPGPAHFTPDSSRSQLSLLIDAGDAALKAACPHICRPGCPPLIPPTPTHICLFYMLMRLTHAASPCSVARRPLPPLWRRGPDVIGVFLRNKETKWAAGSQKGSSVARKRSPLSPGLIAP